MTKSYKFLTISVLFLLYSFYMGITDTSLDLPNLDALIAIISAVCIFTWLHFDALEREIRIPFLLKLITVCFAPIGISYYLIRTRKLKSLFSFLYIALLIIGSIVLALIINPIIMHFLQR